jgi:hypothetical protein
MKAILILAFISLTLTFAWQKFTEGEQNKTARIAVLEAVNKAAEVSIIIEREKKLKCEKDVSVLAENDATQRAEKDAVINLNESLAAELAKKTESLVVAQQQLEAAERKIGEVTIGSIVKAKWKRIF